MYCFDAHSTARRMTHHKPAVLPRMMVFGKIYNARWSIERTCRDHAMRVDTETLKAASAKLKSAAAAGADRD